MRTVGKDKGSDMTARATEKKSWNKFETILSVVAILIALSGIGYSAGNLSARVNANECHVDSINKTLQKLLIDTQTIKTDVNWIKERQKESS